MIITRIKLVNWLAFKGTHILDIPSGPIAVVARYENNSDRSNWAGKTAFLEAIEWALYGNHRKRYEDDIIFEGAEEVSVKLVFDNGFLVSRNRRRGKASRLIVGVPTGNDKMQHHEKQSAALQIRNTLGFDADDFRATVCFSQGDTEAIVNRSSGERRKIIGQWLELDVWQRIQTRARNHLKELTSKYQYWKQEFESKTKELEEFDRDAHSKQIKALETQVIEYKKELKDLDDELEIVVKHHELKETFDLYTRTVNEARILKEELTGATVEGVEGTRAEYEELNVYVSQLASQKEKARKLAQGIFDGVCPVMHDVCPVKEHVIGNKKIADKHFEAIMLQHEQAMSALNQKRSELISLEEKESSLMRKREKFNAVVGYAKILKPKADRWKQTAEYSPEHIHKLKTRREEVRQVISNHETSIHQYTEEIRHTDELRESLIHLEKELEKREQEIKIVNLVVKATGATGIPSYIAESVISKLEERSNALLAESSLSITFSMDRETRDVAPSCFECGYLYKGKKDKACPACNTQRAMKRADELEILVDDNSGVLEDVKAKSGGARALVASSIRLAAGLMLKELRNSQCAFAEIDEVHGSLDVHNSHMITNMFMGMLNSVGLEQAFIVSHDTEVLDALPSRILIVRKGNYSTIEVVQ